MAKPVSRPGVLAFAPSAIRGAARHRDAGPRPPPCPRCCPGPCGSARTGGGTCNGARDDAPPVRREGHHHRGGRRRRAGPPQRRRQQRQVRRPDACAPHQGARGGELRSRQDAVPADRQARQGQLRGVPQVHAEGHPARVSSPATRKRTCIAAASRRAPTVTSPRIGVRSNAASRRRAPPVHASPTPPGARHASPRLLAPSEFLRPLRRS